MTRFLIVLVLLFGLIGGSRAQPAPAQATAPAVAGSTITPEQARQALDMLRDEAKRAAFVATLETIAKAPAATATKLPAPLTPGGLGAEILVTAGHRLEALSGDVLTTVRAVTDFALLAHWLTQFTTDPASQAALLDSAWKLLLVMAGALAAERLTMRALRRPNRLLLAHARPEPDLAADRRPSPLAMLRRLPLVLAGLVLHLLPVLVVLATGNILLGTGLIEQATTRLVIVAVLNAYVLLRVITSVTRVVVAPESAELRILHVSDNGAAYILRWVRRIAAVAVFGHASGEVALLFGLYQLGYDAVLKLVMLAAHVLLIVVVLQKRASVASRIRARPGSSGMLATIRDRVARTWHIVAIFYLIAFWLVWAFEVPDGLARLLHFLLSSFLIVVAARLVAIALLGGVDRALRVTPDLSARYPGLEIRARTYHPVARALANALIIAATGIALFEAWGIDSLAWLASGALGRRLVSALAVVGVTVMLSVLIWELANAGVQRHLDRLNREAQIAKSARLRTLLPMLRTTLLAFIVLVAGLMVLSEVGLNIAPLLAGASVVGIAVGFGSQKLVQDVITGLFLLLENIMQVGDVVTLASLTGTVENLSIRTIRLRALDGAVHVVPFSAVTTVTNQTRDYSYALLDISVGVNEEPDHITEVLRTLAREMRAEATWEAVLKEDLDVMGVEKFLETAWVLRVRVKTLPAQRWAVSRELNRRVKMRFDELAIESPMTSYRVLSTNPPPPADIEAHA